MKKLSLVFLIFALSSQAAFAIIPLLVAGARVVSAGLKTSTGQDIAIGSAIGVGLIFSQINWNRTGTNGSTSNTALYYTNTPRPPSSIESAAGWTQATTGSSPVAPSTSGSPQTMYRMDAQSLGSTSQSTACSLGVQKLNENQSGYVYSLRTVSGSRCNVDRSDIGDAGFFNLETYNGCPTGYGVSGSSCTLSNSAAVQKPADGYCGVVRSGNTYASENNDPDCLGVAPTFAADGTWSVTGADGTTISSAPTGTAGERKITYVEPDSATNTTHTRELTMQDGSTASDSPYIKGVIDKYTQGTGSAATTTPVSPANPATDMSGVTAAVNANTVAVTSAASAQAAWNAGEAARTAADRTADRVVPLSEEIPKLNIPFSNTSVIFSSSSSCPAPIAFSMMGKPFVISYDPMCTLMTTLRPLFLALGAFGAAAIFIGGLKT